jgi:hypothetical protein
MNQKLTIPCPHCGADLAVPSAGYLGSTVSCPQCMNTFVVEDPADQPADSLSINSDTLLDDDHLDAPLDAVNTPTTRPAFPFAINTPLDAGAAPQAGMQVGSRPTRRSRGKIWMLIGAIAVVAVVAFFLVPRLKPPAATGTTFIDLAYMPDDTEMYLHIRVNELLDSPLATTLINSHPFAKLLLDGLGSLTSVAAEDLESISLGVSEFSASIQNPRPLPLREVDFTFLLRFTRLVNVNELVNSLLAEAPGYKNPRKTIHQGLDLYVDSGSPGLAVCVLNDRTFLFGVEHSVRSGVSRGGKSRASSTFSFMDSGEQIQIGFVPRTSYSLDIAIAAIAPLQTEPFQKAFDKVRGNLTGVALGISIDRRVNVSTRGKFIGKESATRYASGMNRGYEILKNQTKDLILVAKGHQAQAMQIRMEMLGDIKANSDGDVGQVTFSFSSETADRAMSTPISKGILGVGIVFSDPITTTWEGRLSAGLASGPGDEKTNDLNDELFTLVLQDVTDESLMGIESMFEAPAYVLMEYLDRWLSENIDVAVTIDASLVIGEAVVKISGINDVEAFAEKIDFATVLDVDKTRNTVTARWHAPGQK